MAAMLPNKQYLYRLLLCDAVQGSGAVHKVAAVEGFDSTLLWPASGRITIRLRSAGAASNTRCDMAAGVVLSAPPASTSSGEEEPKQEPLPAEHVNPQSPRHREDNDAEEN